MNSACNSNSNRLHCNVINPKPELMTSLTTLLFSQHCCELCILYFYIHNYICYTMIMYF